MSRRAASSSRPAAASPRATTWPCVAGVVANAASGQSYDVTWDAIPPARRSTSDEAPDATSRTRPQRPSQRLRPPSNTTFPSPPTFLYRVRAFGGCKQQFTPIRTRPRRPRAVAAATRGQSPNANVPAGSTLKVIQTVFIPASRTALPYAATVDQPWLNVQAFERNADSGRRHPAGSSAIRPTCRTERLQVRHRHHQQRSSGAKRATPQPPSACRSPSASSPHQTGQQQRTACQRLDHPSVGHLDGVNTKWQSDVRLAKPTATKQSTPSPSHRTTRSGRQDHHDHRRLQRHHCARRHRSQLVRRRTLGETANGVLLIVPTTPSGNNSAGVVPNTVSVQTVAVASSRPTT